MRKRLGRYRLVEDLGRGVLLGVIAIVALTIILWPRGATLPAEKGADPPVTPPRSAPTRGKVRTNPADGLGYVWIPPGTFTMGCSPGDNECDNAEKPPHQVTLTSGFWIGQTEVTQGAFEKVFFGAAPLSSFRGTSVSQPA
jgi:formylglycine-generating enzyme required for sulfatase activity